MPETDAVLEDVMHRINRARLEKRHASVEELGGEKLLLRDLKDVIPTSVCAGAVARAVADAWETIEEYDSAHSLFEQALSFGDESALAEVADAVRMLPAGHAARLSTTLLTLMGDIGKAVHWASATMLLVDLASTEVTGWRPLVDALMQVDPSKAEWPANELAVRAAFRVGLVNSAESARVAEYLQRFSALPEIAADAEFALGSLAFAALSTATSEEGVEGELAVARAHFVRSLTADTEHDEARLMHGLTTAILCLRLNDNHADLPSARKDIRQGVANLVHFDNNRQVGSAAPNSTRVGWAQVAALAIKATEMAGADRDRHSTYEILEAALETQRLANAVTGQGKIWVSSIERFLVTEQSFLEAARRVVDATPDDPIADELADILDRLDPGKGPADTLGSASIDEVKMLLVSRLTDAGDHVRAALVASISDDRLLGTPIYEQVLEKILRPIYDDELVPLETKRNLLVAVHHVVSYARRKTDATVGNGGFRDLAGREVDKPLEHHLQDDIGQSISSSALGTGWTDERTNMSGGRADGSLVIGRDRFPFEFKAEAQNASPEELTKYVRQAARYSGGTAPCAFLVVLDTSTESERYNDLLAQAWTVSIPPSSAGARTTHVLVVAIPANMPTPSELSR